MNQLGGFPILTLIVFLPVLGAGVGLLIPAERQEALRWLAALVTSVVFFTSLFLLMGWIYDPEGEFQFVDGPWPWITSLRVSYRLGVDGINLSLVLVTTLLFLVATLTNWLQHHDSGMGKRIVLWALLFEAGILGALTVLDMFMFFAFWLTTMIASFFLLGFSAPSPLAARRFVNTFGIVAVLTLAIVILLGHSQLGEESSEAELAPLDQRVQAWVFWGMILAFGTMSGAFPLHMWYPKAYLSGSPMTQLLIGGLFANLGMYALLRFCVPLVPVATLTLAPIAVIVGVLGLLYGAIAALGQRTLSGTLAYWSISQVGLALIGLFSLGNLGLHGVVLQLSARSLSLAAITIVCATPPSDVEDGETGSVPDRRALAVGFLSALGLPGLAGFSGQGTILLGVLRWRLSDVTGLGRAWDWLLYAATGIGVLAGMAALVRAWHSLPIGPPQSRSSRQALIALPVLLAILFLGMRPATLSDVIGPSVHRLRAEVVERLGSERESQAWSSALHGPESHVALTDGLRDEVQPMPSSAALPARGPASSVQKAAKDPPTLGVTTRQPRKPPP